MIFFVNERIWHLPLEGSPSFFKREINYKINKVKNYLTKKWKRITIKRNSINLKEEFLEKFPTDFINSTIAKHRFNWKDKRIIINKTKQNIFFLASNKNPFGSQNHKNFKTIINSKLINFLSIHKTQWYWQLINTRISCNCSTSIFFVTSRQLNYL